MAETVEDIPEPEVMKSGETVEGDVGGESNTAEVAAVSDISAAGDAGSVATDNAGEAAAPDASVEQEKHADDASASVDTAVLSEDDAVKEDVVSGAAAADDNDGDGDGVAVVTSEVETDASNEAAMQPVTPSDVEEKTEKIKTDTEAEINATTDRVERVTSKADKVTVSVEESSKAGDVSEEAVSSTAVAVDTADVVKSGTTDTATAVNKTTQDVIKMAGNDELKFGVLIGLVRVGQLSNKDVVDSVLCLVSTLISLTGHVLPILLFSLHSFFYSKRLQH